MYSSSSCFILQYIPRVLETLFNYSDKLPSSSAICGHSQKRVDNGYQRSSPKEPAALEIPLRQLATAPICASDKGSKYQTLPFHLSIMTKIFSGIPQIIRRARTHSTTIYGWQCSRIRAKLYPFSSQTAAASIRPTKENQMQLTPEARWPHIWIRLLWSLLWQL